MGNRKERMEEGRAPVGMGRPNYDDWAKKDGWTAQQAAALLLNIEPPEQAEDCSGDAWVNYEQIKRLIEKEQGKSLKCLPLNSLGPYLFAPYAVIAWAEDRDLRVPELLKAAIMESWPGPFRTGQLLAAIQALSGENRQLRSQLETKCEEAMPPYMRRDHVHFAPELCAAVRVWTALFDEGAFDHRLAPKAQIEDWLWTNEKAISGQAAAFSNAAVRRIATVANPLKTGGAPTSQ